MGHESYRDFLSRARRFYLQYLGNITGMNLEAFLNILAKSIGMSKKKLDAINELLLRENGQVQKKALELRAKKIFLALKKVYQQIKDLPLESHEVN
ncbi:MAG: hypothetical protein ACTSQS_13655 [Promethearchaeota archaeon]